MSTPSQHLAEDGPGRAVVFRAVVAPGGAGGVRWRMDEQTAEFYRRSADEVVPRYESVGGGIAALFGEVFGSGDRVLDIGAGSGRDCARLLELGVDAWGAEPSPELRAHAVRLHPALEGKVLAGSLPERMGAFEDVLFDGVVMSAVLMHISEEHIRDSVVTIGSLLRPGGSLLVSFSTAREGIDPGTNREESGRLFVLRSPDEYERLFEELGFALEKQQTSDDSLGRSGFEWVTQLYSLGT